MTLNYLENVANELNIPLTYKSYKGIDNVLFFNTLALAYNSIDDNCNHILITNPSDFPSSCTKKYIKDCIESDSKDLGTIRKINWQNFQDKTFVIVDIETTGFSPNLGAQIIQIGAIKIDEEGNELGRFNQFIKPTIKIPKKIIDLTGITNEMVKEANPMGIVLREFLNFFKGSTLVFHNASFDWDRFLIPFYERLGYKMPSNYPCLDTKLLSREYWPNEKKHDLEVVCDRFGIEIKDHHNAFADVIMTTQIFVKFREVFKDKYKHLNYTIWKFTKPNHSISIRNVNRWDKWMPIKKQFSKLRFYVTFICDGVQGSAYYDFIEKHWEIQNFVKNFNVNELEQPVFQYLKVSSYEEMLNSIPSKNIPS